MKKGLPRIALVGRINAGKSTLFNTLSETGQAIVSPIPGTTRDLNFAEINWRNHCFSLIDTGGLDAGQLGKIENYVQKKAYQTVKQADLILLVIDGRNELLAADKEIAKHLKKSKKNTLLVINKIDGPTIREKVDPDYYKLGLGQPHLVSALNGIGTGDLLDIIIKKIPSRTSKKIDYDLRLSIIGKTNVGKSSILNGLLGQDRVIVTPLPHTTREPQDISLTYQGQNILLVDTAGLRKKRKISEPIEKISAGKTLATIKKSDISLIITDVSNPLSSQDQVIATLALKNQNGIIIVANKWDLIKNKNSQTIDEFTSYYHNYFPGLWWAPIIFTSAIEKQRLTKLLSLALVINKQRQLKIDDKDLKTLIKEVKLKKAKPSKGKKSASYLKLVQTDINPPAFELITNKPARIHPAFLNLLEKKIRSRFGFTGTPIKISLHQN